MNTSVTLDRITPGSAATIVDVQHTDSMSRRLQDLGFTGGSEVKCLFRSAAGDPTAYLIRGTVIALRQEDSAHILVDTAEKGYGRHEA